MHAWELQKGLFISLLKIDLLLHGDVKSFRGQITLLLPPPVALPIHTWRLCSPLTCRGKSSLFNPAARLILWGSLLSRWACSTQDFTMFGLLIFFLLLAPHPW